MDIEELESSPSGQLTLKQVRERINEIIKGRVIDLETVKELPTKDYVNDKTNDNDITDFTEFTHQSPSRRATRVYVQSKISNSELSGSSSHTNVAPSRKAVSGYMTSRIDNTDLEDSNKIEYKAASRGAIVKYVMSKIDDSTLLSTTTSTKIAPSQKAVVDFCDSIISEMIKDKTYTGAFSSTSTSKDWATGGAVAQFVSLRIKREAIWDNDISTTTSKEILKKINERANLKVLDQFMSDDSGSTTRAPSRKVVADYVKGKISNSSLSGSSSHTNVSPSRRAVSEYMTARIIDDDLSDSTTTNYKAPSRRAVVKYARGMVLDTNLTDGSTSGNRAPSKRAVAAYVKSKVATLRVQKTISHLDNDPLQLGTIAGIKFYIQKKRDLISGDTTLLLSWDKPIALEGSTGNTYQYRGLPASHNYHEIGELIDQYQWEGYITFRGHTRVDNIDDFKSITINISNSNDKKKFNFLAALI